MINLTNKNNSKQQANPGEIIKLSNGKILYATSSDYEDNKNVLYNSDNATASKRGNSELNLYIFNSDGTLYKALSRIIGGLIGYTSSIKTGIDGTSNWSTYNGQELQIIENGGYIYIYMKPVEGTTGTTVSSYNRLHNSYSVGYQTILVYDLDLNFQNFTIINISSSSILNYDTNTSYFEDYPYRKVNSNSFFVADNGLTTLYPTFQGNSANGTFTGTFGPKSRISETVYYNGITKTQLVAADTTAGTWTSPAMTDAVLIQEITNIIPSNLSHHTVYINTIANTLVKMTTSGVSTTTISTATGGVQTTAANICLFKGYNNKIFIAYVSGTSILYKEWNTVANTFSVSKTLGGGTGNGANTNFINNYITQFGINKFISNIPFKSGFSSCIFEQDLSTNDLTITVQSANSLNKLFTFNGKIFDYTTTYSLRAINTNNVTAIIPSTSAIVPSASGTAYFDSLCQQKRYFDSSKGYWKLNGLIEDGNYIYTSILNTSGGLAGINAFMTRITPAVVNVTSTFKSVNFVTTGMTGFTYTDTKTVPGRTSVTYRYSTNNGGAWTAFTAGTPVTVSGSTLLIEITINPTTTDTPIISDYSIVVAK